MSEIKAEVLAAQLLLVQTVLKGSKCVCDRCTELRHWVKTNTTKEESDVQ